MPHWKRNCAGSYSLGRWRIERISRTEWRIHSPSGELPNTRTLKAAKRLVEHARQLKLPFPTAHLCECCGTRPIVFDESDLEVRYCQFCPHSCTCPNGAKRARERVR